MTMTIVEQHYQMIEHWDNALKLELIAKLQQDIAQKQSDKPLNDLSKLVEHDNVFNGDFNELVQVSWEKEVALDVSK